MKGLDLVRLPKGREKKGALEQQVYLGLYPIQAAGEFQPTTECQPGASISG